MAGGERYQPDSPGATPNDLARRWWRAELVAADAEGKALPESPPGNLACRLALSSPEGSRRCAGSIAFAADLAKNKGVAAHECHLGFSLVAAASAGEAVVCCGLRERTCADAELVALGTRLRELRPSDPAENKLVPIAGVGREELERAADLAELAASRERPAIRAKASKTGRRASDSTSMVGQSLAMLEVQRLLEKVAQTDATVLVQGESGTGKELVARQLHERGARRERPFVAQNCSALNDNLLESALFGHVRGAFTGATRDARGLFELADGGTLFLDEVGDTSPALQAKLLRVLQEGTFTPVGGAEVRRCDVRVIAATHKDLADLVRQKAFREDLYYRINVIRMVVPPLRERDDDVDLLAATFLRRFARGEKPPKLSPETTAVFRRYPWPGNVRELQNEIERLSVLAGDAAVIGPELVSPRIVAGGEPRKKPVAVQEGEPLPRLNDAVETLEKELLSEALRRFHGNRSQVARELGIARSNLILKLSRYGLA